MEVSLKTILLITALTLSGIAAQAEDTDLGGYASQNDGAGTTEFAFGVKANCKLSFFRVTTQE